MFDPLCCSYVVDTFLDEMNRLAKKSTHDQINSYYFMGSLILEVLLEVVQQDGMLAIFSLLFVFIWIRINTGSWFLAGVGILEIFVSIPIAWFFFSVVFQIKFFAFLNGKYLGYQHIFAGLVPTGFHSRNTLFELFLQP